MVTGQVPFDGDSTVSIAIKHLQEEITPPSDIVDGIPYSLEQIILKCTQKNSERRYANTALLIQDLKRSLVNPEGEFVVIPPLRNADTVIITDEELDDIRNGYDQNDQDNYDDEYNDNYDNYDNYDDEYSDYDDYDDEQRKRTKGKKDSDDVNPGMKRIMKILTIVVAVIIVFILVFAVGKAVGLFKTGGPGITAEEEAEEVEVPNVVGYSEEEAKKILHDLNLGYKKVSSVESEKYDKGIVCEQKVKAGSMVPLNTMIEVVVSSKLVGEEIIVPDVKGYDEETAQKMLADAGLTKVKAEFVYTDSYDAGDVIGTTPEAGSSVTAETSIIMQVSKGSEKVEVPDVEGDTESTAIAKLKDAGIKIEKTIYDYNDDVEKGKVVSQSLTPGKKVDKGATIILEISNGPKPEEKVSVPNLSGLTLEGARALLESKGLVLADGGEEYSEEDIGKVSRWEPYNTSVTKGTVITVWISKGLEEIPEEIPEEIEDETFEDEVVEE